MGYASYLVYREGGWKLQAVPLALYGTQLALNAAWSPLFFGAKQLGTALVDISLLDVTVAACAYYLYLTALTLSVGLAADFNVLCYCI